MAAKAFHAIRGLYLGKHFPEDTVMSTLAYKPQPDDIFVVSYPKCGTTWVHHIVYNILMNAQEPKDPLDQVLRMPFLEMQGAEAALYAPKPHVLKTHLPFHMSPYSKEAKYIYITRNPYDCCVSFYYHTKQNPPYQFGEGTFDEFLELFLEGRVDFGDYFDNVLSWYEHRNDPNVLFLTYENLRKDTTTYVLQIAGFISQERGKKLKENPELLQGVLEKASLEYMKRNISDSWQAPRRGFGNSPQMDSLRPELLKGLHNVMAFTKLRRTGHFVRKGQVGDWRNHFSQGQIERMKRKIYETRAGPELMALWRETDIP
ncbi:hypothetical protein MRX96_001910 [Rhipicephalus microplus]